MRRKTTILISAALMIAACAAHAELLWQERPDGKTICSAPKREEIHVHDLVTIIVKETAQSSSKSDLSTDKSYEFDSTIDSWFNVGVNGLDDVKARPALGASPEASFNSDRTHQGSGKAASQATFDAQITAEVADVLPNGNLILAARRHVKTDEDEYTIVLSAVARQVDVTSDNTIPSARLADLEVTYKPEGAVRDSSKRGWLTKAIDRIWPF